MLTGPAPIEGVERINTVMVCSNQRAVFAQHNLYAMDVNRGNRNCYNYRGFGHLARNCRNRGMGNKIGEGKRLEYRNRSMIKGGNENNSNLNEDRDLIVLN